MDTIQKLIDQVLGLGPEMLLFVALCGLGYTLKLLPMVNNQWIPIINMAVGAGGYPFLRQPASAPYWVPYPFFYFVVVGFVIFVLEWLFHNKILKLVEDKLGLFDNKPSEQTAKPNP